MLMQRQKADKGRNMQVNTTQGKPPRINREWFRARYGQNFPELLSMEYDDMVDNAIESVYTLFAGVCDIWNHLERNVYVEKTQLCYGLLVAWYLTDLNPTFAEGVMTTGGIGVKAKKIGGTQIMFADNDGTKKGAQNNADLLGSLRSNAFGAKAYLMIKTSGKINMFFQY
jgi:hypothetical protein